MQKLKLGVIGVSNHFLKRCRIPIQNSKFIDLHAIASRDIEKSKRTATKFNIPLFYGSYEAVLQNKDIDFVYIPLPNHMHYEWVKKAADAGKHILCEKPIAMHKQEAEAMVDYCQTKGVRLMEAFMYRFHPQWKKAKEILDSGELGKIQTIHTYFGYSNPDPKNIRNIKYFGGGALMDIGCYAINTPRYLTGLEPRKVIGFVNRHPQFQTDVLSSGMMDFDGVHATFTVSTDVYPHQKVEVGCTGGRLTIELPFNTFQDVEAVITITTPVGIRKVHLPICDQYGEQFDAFAMAILENKPVPTPISDAVNNMSVIDALLRSEVSQKWETVK